MGELFGLKMSYFPNIYIPAVMFSKHPQDMCHSPFFVKVNQKYNFKFFLSVPCVVAWL